MFHLAPLICVNQSLNKKGFWGEEGCVNIWAQIFFVLSISKNIHNVFLSASWGELYFNRLHSIKDLKFCISSPLHFILWSLPYISMYSVLSEFGCSCCHLSPCLQTLIFSVNKHINWFKFDRLKKKKSQVTWCLGSFIVRLVWRLLPTQNLSTISTGSVLQSSPSTESKKPVMYVIIGNETPHQRRFN